MIHKATFWAMLPSTGKQVRPRARSKLSRYKFVTHSQWEHAQATLLKKVAQCIISIRGVSILPLCWLGIVGAVAIAFVPGVDSISGPYLCRSFILLPNSAVPIDTVSACRCIMGRRWLLFPAVSCVTSRVNDRELGHITVLCFYSITKHMIITSVSTRNRPVCHFKTEWRAGFDTPTVYLTFFCLFWGKRFDENGV